MSFSELRKELIGEFYFYLDSRGHNGMKHLLDEYYTARGCYYAAFASDSEGTKIVISTDTTKGLTEQVRKLSLFADHIIIRHKTLVPRYMEEELFSGFESDENSRCSEQFSPLKTDVLDASMPYFCSCPVPNKLTEFISWLDGEGREWVKNGLVTYVPVMFPEDFDFVCFDEEININSLFRESGLLPNASNRLNTSSANAVKEIEFPYIANITPDAVNKLKIDHQDLLINFQNTLLNSFSNIESTNLENFEREIDYIYHNVIEEGIQDIQIKIKKAKRIQGSQTKSAVLTTGFIGLAFYFGAPPAAVVAALAKPVYDIYQSRINRFEAMEDIKNKPMYMFIHLSQNKP